MPKTKVKLIENFLVVWDSAEGSELYKAGYYGKPLGIPKPKIPEFDAPLILDLMEGLYLLENKKIEIYEHSNEKKVSLTKLKQKAKQLYDEFEEKYAVYHDLRDSNLIVTPGIKFGCDFAVYKYGPGVEHAPYTVSVKKAGSPAAGWMDPSLSEGSRLPNEGLCWRQIMVAAVPASIAVRFSAQGRGPRKDVPELLNMLKFM